MSEDSPYMKRSREFLPFALEIDRATAEAFANKSVSDLQAIYERLETEADRSQQFLGNGGAATACDVAQSTLLIVVGFSINKMDGQGRYEDWMEDESLRLLSDYRQLVAACGEDAKTPALSRITEEMIKNL
ncbi:hypothetical protein E2F50_07350 [Rhizobium deserti]|uniref:Uncharacterized protein n=1 Tax=Rhizobium deserti TaxID=2547961 RepID=A0A4R5UIS6_9HYPH|nr:hypothetical protein [Rhizobium deserti]TDK36731.1 hypothetical protein E2F50_07350 [Rhizobium deserti]